jgi:hypothetical protein
MFGELRHLLSAEADWTSWGAVRRLIDVMADAADPRFDAGALEYARTGAGRWPDRMRDIELSAQRYGEPAPHATLARAFEWERTGDHERQARWWDATEQITCLSTDAPVVLRERPEVVARLPALRALDVQTVWMDDALALMEAGCSGLEQVQLEAVELELGMGRLLGLPGVEGWRSVSLELLADDGTDDPPPPDLDGVMLALARSERLVALEQLSISGYHATTDLRRACAQWRAARPSALSLSLCGVSAGSLDALDETLGKGLVELSLGHVDYVASELRRLLSLKRPLPALRRLQLSGERSDAGTLKGIAGRPLVELSSTFADLSDPALCALLADEPLRLHMQDLALGAASITPQGIAALCAQPWPALRRLSLWHNALGDAGAAHLARPGVMDGLEQLALPNTQLSDEGLGHLVQGLPNVHTLHLRENKLTDAGVIALAASPAAARLRVLDLSDNPALTIASLRALLDPQRLPSLLSLSLYRTAAHGDPAARALAAEVVAQRPWVTVGV